MGSLLLVTKTLPLQNCHSDRLLLENIWENWIGRKCDWTETWLIQGWSESMLTVQCWMDKLCDLTFPVPELLPWSVSPHDNFLTCKWRCSFEKQRPVSSHWQGPTFQYSITFSGNFWAIPVICSHKEYCNFTDFHASFLELQHRLYQNPS